MRRFDSVAEMVAVHEAMFGDAGRYCAEAIVRSATAFDEPVDALAIRIMLAPVEIGPYNRHSGYVSGSRVGGGGFSFILGNRHICEIADDGSVILCSNKYAERTADFVMHELTHLRQGQLIRKHGYPQTRGDHRDKGWFHAISEAAPRYLGVAFPRSIWPVQKPKPGCGRLTEVEVTHWPTSFRQLIASGDPRLRAVDEVKAAA